MIKKKEVTTMYLRRKIDDYLKNWKMADNRLPLIVKGARQTGKTESILHFASQYYSNIIVTIQNPFIRKRYPGSHLKPHG
jgi:hypothetical protein